MRRAEPRVLALILAFGGCTTVTTTPATCVTGASAACACASGQQGAQICMPNGTFGLCSCAVGDGGLPDARVGQDGVLSDAALPDASPPDAPAATTGTYFHYVTNSMKVGSTVAEADSYAFNLDCDPGNMADNAIGHVLAGLSSMLDTDTSVAASIASGQVILLHSVRADSLTSDPTVSWQVYPGSPTTNPVLTGGGTFSIDPSGQTYSPLEGSISGGQYLGGPGKVDLQLGLVAGEPPIDITLAGARIEATCTSTSCTNAKLGGGVSASDMMTKVIPAMAADLNAKIQADGQCSTMCTVANACSSQSTQILDLFDTNHDCMITAGELESNSLVQAILMPDVDLLDAAGNPCGCSTGVTCDGVKESVSLGIGFTTESATFTATGELSPDCRGLDGRPTRNSGGSRDHPEKTSQTEVTPGPLAARRDAHDAPRPPRHEFRRHGEGGECHA